MPINMLICKHPIHCVYNNVTVTSNNTNYIIDKAIVIKKRIVNEAIYSNTETVKFSTPSFRDITFHIFFTFSSELGSKIKIILNNKICDLYLVKTGFSSSSSKFTYEYVSFN